MRAYVHVPFCTARCGYCDFNTYTAAELGGTFSFARYTEAIVAEIASAGRVHGRPLASIFFGGGTPSLLPMDSLATILGALRESFGFAEDCEITLEANPESTDDARLARWRELGVNRLSIGMQSMDGATLRLLDRRHGAEESLAAVRAAHAAGFDHVSLDLIYGTPGQSEASWGETVSAAIGVGPDHVSAYALVVEEGTALARKVARGQATTPESDVAAAHYEVADHLLSAAGFRWYEVSNWARSGGECRHNLGYWRSEDWWGFGPGAHSHVGGIRWWNVKNPGRYSRALLSGQSPVQEREQLTDEQRLVENTMLSVRVRETLPESAAAVAAAHGWLHDGELTVRGRLMADAVVREALGW